MKPGATGAFEVTYDDEVLYSMLKTGKHAEFNDVRDMIAGRVKMSPSE